MKKVLMIIGGFALLDALSEIAVGIAGGRFGLFSKGDIHKAAIKISYATPDWMHQAVLSEKHRILFWYSLFQK